jgi:hypothetical protein
MVRMAVGTDFEAALARLEADLDDAGRSGAATIRGLKRAKAAAATGEARDLRRLLSALQEQIAQLSEQVRDAAERYDVDEASLLASGAYAKELLAAAADAGISMFEEDERLLCYPSIIRLLPNDLAIEVDRKRTRALRPSTVVAALARVQRSGPRFRPEPFLASLVGAYDLVVAEQGKSAGAVVRLLDVYNVLTLLPGQAREYTKPEFARDLYLLDQAGLTTVSGTGRRLRWAASTGTKQAGVLTTVARSGQQQRYWGIAFDEPRS